MNDGESSSVATLPPRRSQEERSSATRAAVNDATIRCLTTAGYAGTTMSTVAETAGVSRGAITHQYGNKREMLLAAIDELIARRQAETLRAVRALAPSPDRPREVLALLWEVYRSDLFAALVEVWNAARTDDELRQVLREVERQHGRQDREVLAEAFGPQIAGHPNFATALELTHNLMRGLALTSVLRVDPDREHALVDGWTSVFVSLTSPGADAVVSTAGQAERSRADGDEQAG